MIDTKIDVPTVTKDDLLVSICHDHCYCSNRATCRVKVKAEVTQNRCEKACQMDLSNEDLDQMTASAKTLKVEAKLKRTMFLKDVTQTDSSVTFYTGLPSVVYIKNLFNQLATQTAKRIGMAKKMVCPRIIRGKKKTNKLGRKCIFPNSCLGSTNENTSV